MDEEKLRKALRTFFKEYAKITKKIDELGERLKEKAPIKKEDIPKALKIFNEEIQQADLPFELRIIMGQFVNKVLAQEPEYIS